MLFEVPAFGPFKKKSTPEVSEPETPFSQMTREEREWAMRDQLRKPGYEETSLAAGKGIIVGGEPETYPEEKGEVPVSVHKDGILVAEGESDCSTEEKVGFMEGWSEDLSGVARSIPGIFPGRAGNSRYENSTGLLVEWDAEGVRPVWIRATGSGDSFRLRREEIREFSEIAEAFSLSELEGAFDGARIALERLTEDDERKKNGPQPPSAESEA
ncbi:MAG TPA: hypothetical protein VN420_00735 [Candidatus Fimivivens sp.]|nr:hypothetical protein [Candidatus Fimivivens sp.]